jgi:hypothetical protein
VERVVLGHRQDLLQAVLADLIAGQRKKRFFLRGKTKRNKNNVVKCSKRLFQMKIKK